MMRQLFTERTPRVLSIDFVGEVARDNPDAVVTFGYDELREALSDLAGTHNWHIAAQLLESEAEKILQLLCPPLVSSDSYSYGRAIGGLALDCTECDVLFPNAGCSDLAKSALKRGRHYGLSLYLATQRAAECARVVTSQAHVIFSFRQDEPRDVAYLEGPFSRAIAREVIPHLPKHHSVMLTKDTGRVFVLNEHYAPVNILDKSGAELSSSSA